MIKFKSLPNLVTHSIKADMDDFYPSVDAGNSRLLKIFNFSYIWDQDVLAGSLELVPYLLLFQEHVQDGWLPYIFYAILFLFFFVNYSRATCRFLIPTPAVLVALLCFSLLDIRFMSPLLYMYSVHVCVPIIIYIPPPPLLLQYLQ
jgi:hypothetical protein